MNRHKIERARLSMFPITGLFFIACSEKQTLENAVDGHFMMP